MDKIVIEYNSFHNKKIAKALEKAAMDVLEQYHVDKVFIGQYTQYVPAKRLFAYVGEADKINYDEILDMLYNHLAERPDVDMCGPKSREALQQIGAILAPQIYTGIEDSITAGFAENARNGFRYGAACMGELMRGGKS